MEAERQEAQPPATGGGDASAACSWSEQVEDLLASGDRDAAISLLESVVSELSSRSPCLRLSSALEELARIHYAAGFSLKADQLNSQALIVRQRAHDASSSSPPASRNVEVDGKLKAVEDVGQSAGLPCRNLLLDGSLSSLGGLVEQSMGSSTGGNNASASKGASDDDWEAIADREPNDLLPPDHLPDLSMLVVEDKKPPVQDKKPQGPKRRGRGTFSYKKQELYSDQLSDDSANDEEIDEDLCINSEGNVMDRHSKYGTHHVLVLTGFPPSTRTMELEKLLDDFKGRGVVIRWVNDTTALAVFRSPAIACEARDNIQFPFTVRILGEEDELLSSIPVRDLEPPRQRPQTSARTAQRLIAQSMGLKLPSSFNSREFRQQEEARKDRIIRRQKLRDDAWGAD